MYCINCSNELTQSLMHALGLEELQQTIALYEEAVQQTVQQIEMVSNLVKQYENMVQNTVKLPAQLVNQVTGTFRELGGTVAQLQQQVGDVAALGEIVEQLYGNPDFLAGLATAGRGEQPQLNAQYYAKWQQWTETIEDGCESLFKISGQQLQDLIQDADAFDDHIAELLSTPEGQMEALEAANALASLQLDEARQLRALLLSSQQLMAEVQMKREQTDRRTTEAWKEFTRTDKLTGVSGKSPADDPF